MVTMRLQYGYPEVTIWLPRGYNMVTMRLLHAMVTMMLLRGYHDVTTWLGHEVTTWLP